MTEAEIKIVQALMEEVKLLRETNSKLDSLLKINTDILNFWALLRDEVTETNSMNKDYLAEMAKENKTRIED